MSNRASLFLGLSLIVAASILGSVLSRPVASAAAPDGRASDGGRYRIVVANPPMGSTPATEANAFVLDTITGQVWEHGLKGFAEPKSSP